MGVVAWIKKLIPKTRHCEKGSALLHGSILPRHCEEMRSIDVAI
ncbi:hypothetical protein [Rickettsia endosymbiont of Ceutorhynchus obstrictus]